MGLRQSEILCDWSLLNREAHYLIEKTKRGWRNLLQLNLREEEYHSYLAEHAGFFFGNVFNGRVVISKLRLSPEFTTDFVVVRDQYSLGMSFELIEIELPHRAPLTKSGDFSARLSHAVGQIQNWRKWIKENPALARKLFPSLGTRFYRSPNFTFTVIIGNRANTNDWLEKRNDYANQLRINIRSFDHLSDVLSNVVFLNETSFCSNEEEQLSKVQRNQLANPFYKAYTDQEWREIVRQMEHTSHFVAMNADVLISNRQYNKLFQRFVSESKSV